MGLLDQPALTDTDTAIQKSVNIPATSRSYSVPDSYPKEHLTQSTTPLDLQGAEDSSNEFIKQVQTVMKGNPISPSYPGPIDGKISRKLLDVLLNFSWALQRKSNKSVSIVSGSLISESGWSSAMKILDEFLNPTKKEELLDQDSLVKSFQVFFSKSHALFGPLYSGPQDGIMSDELVAAGMAAEKIIAKLIDNQGVRGMIINVAKKKLTTTTEDVASAMKMIENYKGKKVASFGRKERMLVFSSLINK